MRRSWNQGQLAGPAHARGKTSPANAWRLRDPVRAAPSNPRAVPVFLNPRLQHLFVQAQIGDELLQPMIFIPQCAQLLGLVHLRSAVLRFPDVDRVLENSDLPCQIAAVRPASSCFSTPMICSVLSFLFDIPVLPSFARNPTSFRVSSGDQVRKDREKWTLLHDGRRLACECSTPGRPSRPR